MLNQNRNLFLLAAMPLVATLIGCGDGIERVPLSGKVSYLGQPVADGQIRFIPAPGTKMPLTVEKIKDGRYETKINGGVPVGTYQVAIRAYHPDDPEPTGPGQPARRQLLPAKYSSRSELTITLESGEGAKTKDFELK